MPAPPAKAGLERLFGFLAAQRNDLEAPATAVCPPIAEALAALAAQPGCRLARMSGSGATCFGLFAGEAEAVAAAAALRRARPGWWIAAADCG
jgi:4-diphosphocytidyl-2-C-methyl-D-erythritol kinase